MYINKAQVYQSCENVKLKLALITKNPNLVSTSSLVLWSFIYGWNYGAMT